MCLPQPPLGRKQCCPYLAQANAKSFAPFSTQYVRKGSLTSPKMCPSRSNPATEKGLSAGEIRAELERVLTFPDFAASRHLINFLRFVVEESLAGRAESLKERTVALGALGRKTDFDPRMDCIVRVVAGRLRRTLERYYATLGASNPLSIVIRAGSYA